MEEGIGKGWRDGARLLFSHWGVQSNEMPINWSYFTQVFAVMQCQCFREGLGGGWGVQAQGQRRWKSHKQSSQLPIHGNVSHRSGFL